MENTILEARKLNAIHNVVMPTVLNDKFSNKLRWFFVLDFESTCFSNSKPRGVEIIVLLDSSTGKIVDTFERFVKPIENPKLSTFCINLTGIEQEKVDGALALFDVLKEFESWLKKTKESLGCSFRNHLENTAVFVTWTDWDISTCLWDECRRKKIALPGDLLNRIDLKAIFQQWIGRHNVGQNWRGGLRDALQLVGLDFEGRPHRGIDDAKNTAHLLMHLLTKNVFLRLPSA